MTNRPYSGSPSPDSDTGPTSGGYLALVVAWLVPGLGHFILGEKTRGILFGVTIHALFAAGMLLAGLRAINPPEQAIWTYTQFLAGWPMLVANHYDKTLFSDPYVKQDPDDTARPQRSPMIERYDNTPPGWRSRNDLDAGPNTPAGQERIAHAKEFLHDHPLFAYQPKIQDVGAVYCGIAGMLNLLVLFDVLLRITGAQRETPEEKPRRAAAATDKAGDGIAGSPQAAAGLSNVAGANHRGSTQSAAPGGAA